MDAYIHFINHPNPPKKNNQNKKTLQEKKKTEVSATFQ